MSLQPAVEIQSGHGSTPTASSIPRKKRCRDSKMRARGKIACIECRRRKVRCDIERQRDRCTNCKLDQIECVIDGSTKRAHLATAEPGPVTTTVSSTPSVRAGSMDVDSKEPPWDHYQPVGSHAQGSPSHLKAEEIRYLQAIRVFDVPKDPIVKVLLTAYIKHVHCFFPVLDLRAFLESILMHGADESTSPGQDQNSRRRVSLVLLHAVLAAGLVYVDGDVVQQAGWSSRDGFRTDLLRRVKALYHMNYEHNQLVLCQICILVSIAEEDPDRPDEGRKWLDLAWLHLQSASSVADSDSSNSASPEPRTRAQTSGPASPAALWRRLWWACYVQDRRLAMAARLPTLHPSGQDVMAIAPLSHKDFEVRCHSTVITEAFPSLPMLRSTEFQEELIRLCIAHNELYTHLDCILRCENVSFACGPWSWGLDSSSGLSPRRLPDQGHGQSPNRNRNLTPDRDPQAPLGRRRRQQHPPQSLFTYEHCYQRLFGWVKTHARYVLHKHDFGETDHTLLAHFMELQIVSTSALNLLTSSRLFSPTPSRHTDTDADIETDTRLDSWGFSGGATAAAPAQRNLVFKLLQTATDVTNAFVTLANHRLLHCLSPGMLQLLMPAAAIHFKQCSSPNGKCRSASLWRLSQCLGVFQRLKHTYSSADTSSTFLEKTLSEWMASGGSLSHPEVDALTPSPCVEAQMQTQIPLIGGESTFGDESIDLVSSHVSAATPGPVASTGARSQATTTGQEQDIHSGTDQDLDDVWHTTPVGNVAQSSTAGGRGPASVAAVNDMENDDERYFFYDKIEGDQRAMNSSCADTDADTDMIRAPSLISDGLESSYHTPTDEEASTSSHATTPCDPFDGQISRGRDEERNQRADDKEDEDEDDPQQRIGISLPYCLSPSPAAADYEPLIAWHATEFVGGGYIVMPDMKDDLDLDFDLDGDLDGDGDLKCIAPSRLVL